MNAGCSVKPTSCTALIKDGLPLYHYNILVKRGCTLLAHFTALLSSDEDMFGREQAGL